MFLVPQAEFGSPFAGSL